MNMGAMAGGMQMGNQRGASCPSQLAAFAGKGADFSRGSENGNLWVTGFPNDWDELLLYKVFAPMGKVFNIKLNENERGAVAFIQYETDEEAQNAMAGLHQSQLASGNVLRVEKMWRKKDNKGKGKGQQQEAFGGEPE